MAKSLHFRKTFSIIPVCIMHNKGSEFFQLLLRINTNSVIIKSLILHFFQVEYIPSIENNMILHKFFNHIKVWKAELIPLGHNNQSISINKRIIRIFRIFDLIPYSPV